MSETYWIYNRKKILKPDGHLDIKTHLEFCKENFSDFIMKNGMIKFYKVKN